MNNISQQLIRAREMRNMNLEQLSIKTGIPIETMASIESGAHDPAVSILLKICQELNCTFILGDCSI